jgi:aspartokinase
MRSVAQAVETIIEQKPFIQEALSKGIVNNAALAEEIKPQIEKELKKTIKFSAVNMAIRRLAEKLKETFVVKAKFNQESDLTVKSNLIEIVIYKTPEIQEQIKKIYDIVDFKKGDFLTVTQGLYEIMVIVNHKHEEKIKALFSQQSIRQVVKNLSSLTIALSEEAIETIGLFYQATRALNWENINIIDIVSTYTEMTYILKEEDTARGFETLKRLLSNHT